MKNFINLSFLVFLVSTLAQGMRPAWKPTFKPSLTSVSAPLTPRIEAVSRRIPQLEMLFPTSQETSFYAAPVSSPAAPTAKLSSPAVSTAKPSSASLKEYTKKTTEDLTENLIQVISALFAGAPKDFNKNFLGTMNLTKHMDSATQIVNILDSTRTKVEKDAEIGKILRGIFPTKKS